jgi:CheY-like chemotaxis protein
VSKPLHVLMVEDDPGDVELSRLSLEQAKLRLSLSVVSDGVEAMEYLKTKPKPDLILLDLQLPRMDGREVLRRVRADEALKRIPVVILTATDDDQVMLKACGLGANYYLTKPAGFEGLARIVAQAEDLWFTIVRVGPEPTSPARAEPPRPARS